jgi:predicted nucleic acid-binding protein
VTVPVIVPDASVLLKWVIESVDEHERTQALSIREAWLAGRCSIVLPSLWFFEVGNVLGLKQPSLANEFMELLTEYGFEEEPPAAVYNQAFDFMKKFKVTFYDAAYHSIAATRSGTMITADEAYYRKTLSAGHIELLADWSPPRN